MKHDTQLKILDELFEQLDNHRNVDSGMIVKNPASSYTCPELANRERELFFKHHPQLIGLSGDLQSANDFFTCDDFGVPVLATRDTSGKFRAFINSCRHRGVQLVAESRGNSRRFSCPFHAWTYATDGKLLSIPQENHFGKIDKNCHGLLELPAEERFGMLWIHPQVDGELDLDELLGSLGSELADLDLQHFVFSELSTIDKALNWKLANDTFGETYHFQKLHKQTLGKRSFGDNLSYETFGRNHRFVFARRAIEFLRDKPRNEWNIFEGATVLYYLFPNIQLAVSGASVAMVRIYPDAKQPGRSITRISHYFSQQAIDSIERKKLDDSVKIIDASNVYDDVINEKFLITVEGQIEVFNSTIADEDYVMGEKTQKVVESGALEHLVFGRNEAPLRFYHNNFRELLDLPPLKSLTE